MEALTFSHDDLDTLTGHFQALAERVPLHPIRDAAEYDAAVRVMNGLLDAGAGEEGHPLAGLLDVLGSFIGEYDEAQHRLPDATPAEILRLLMEQHGLRQGDLPEVGSQGVVSEVLSGRRALNLGQIRRLAERFGVAPGSFL
ncbi:transcriptional regulator [Methylobacterium sp. Leaf456]|uniref:helix-turn-helix domain-containing protein n=1 Tax=Methylobacterium sp. Leaf456 TaxID=1736382 RepID=UPI0006F982BF|nr:transcriptional regulator [Methylobacterium sp. Leaf456]KQT60816.1 transcriptional regulator [Methylobacterium sp. Leaf456]